MTFYCPLCDFNSEGMWTLKRHFNASHNKGYCPICKRKYNNLLSHVVGVVRYKSDLKHLILFYLITKRNRTKMFKIARELAYEYLQDKNFKF